MFEYMKLKVELKGLFKNKKVIKYEGGYIEDYFLLFNHLGRERWEMVNIIMEDGLEVFYFKRKINEK